MTESIERTVWCDSNDCVRWDQVAEPKLSGARRHWRERGWRRRRSGKEWPYHYVDACPACVRMEAALEKERLER